MKHIKRWIIIVVSLILVSNLVLFLLNNVTISYDGNFNRLESQVSKIDRDINKGIRIEKEMLKELRKK